MVDITKTINDKGPGFVLAMDTQRIWATGMQAFMNGDTTLLVFREQNIVALEHDADPVGLVANVASIVVPTATLNDFVKKYTEIMEQPGTVPHVD